MIQFNLLPKVKVDFIKTKRLKRTIIGISLLAIVVAVVIVGAAFSLQTVQKVHVSNLDKDIDKLTAELNAVPELTNIISVQNQLNTLPGLYAGRPAVKRLPAYLDQTTPTDVGISQLSVDFSLSTMNVSGTATSLEAVNRYIDTLKFTKYQANDSTEALVAFKDVVLSNFGRNEKTASFSITLAFDPAIFDETQQISLVIPATVTTRSQSQASTELFNGSGN